MPWLTAALPRSHRARVLAAGALVDAVATGQYQAVATLYFVGVDHFPAVWVGWALSAANICGLIVPLPVARLTQRLDLARIYIAVLVLRGVGMAGYVLAGSFWSYLAVTVFFTAASRAALPLLQALVGVMEGEAERTRTMASMRMVNNVGLGTGFFITAGVQALHSRAAYLALFAAGGAAFAVVAAVTAAATRGLDQRAVAPAPKTGPRARGVYADRRFIAVAAANAVMLLHDSMLFILIPLWVVERSGLPSAVSSVLLLLNTVVTVLAQVRLARYGTGVDGAMRLMRWSVLALACAALLLGSASSRGAAPWVLAILLAAAVLALTAGENMHAVAGWELSFVLSDPAMRTQYLSLFSLGYSGQLIVGPVLMTAVVLPWGMPGLLLMTGLFACAVTVTWAAVRGRGTGTRTREGPAPAE